MKAKDGKFRDADVLDTEGIFRLIESVPSNIVASIFAFKKAELFQIEEHKRENKTIKI